MKGFILFLLVLTLIVGAFFVGRASVPEVWTQCFYAVITEKSGSKLTVSGIPENDINHRGEFTFTLDEDVTITWRYSDIPLEQLEVGDRISVTYTGMVMEVSPAIIQDVRQVQLLEDDK